MAAKALLCAAGTVEGLLEKKTELMKKSTARAHAVASSSTATEHATSASPPDPAASATGDSRLPLTGLPRLESSENGYLLGNKDLEKIVALLLWMAQDFQSNIQRNDIHHAALEVVIEHIKPGKDGTLGLLYPAAVAKLAELIDIMMTDTKGALKDPNATLTFMRRVAKVREELLATSIDNATERVESSAGPALTPKAPTCPPRLTPKAPTVPPPERSGRGHATERPGPETRRRVPGKETQASRRGRRASSRSKSPRRDPRREAACSARGPSRERRDRRGERGPEKAGPGLTPKASTVPPPQAKMQARMTAMQAMPKTPCLAASYPYRQPPLDHEPFWQGWLHQIEVNDGDADSLKDAKQEFVTTRDIVYAYVVNQCAENLVTKGKCKSCEWATALNGDGGSIRLCLVWATGERSADQETALGHPFQWEGWWPCAVIATDSMIWLFYCPPMAWARQKTWYVHKSRLIVHDCLRSLRHRGERGPEGAGSGLAPKAPTVPPPERRGRGHATERPGPETRGRVPGKGAQASRRDRRASSGSRSPRRDPRREVASSARGASRDRRDRRRERGPEGAGSGLMPKAPTVPPPGRSAATGNTTKGKGKGKGTKVPPFEREGLRLMTSQALEEFRPEPVGGGFVVLGTRAGLGSSGLPADAENMYALVVYKGSGIASSPKGGRKKNPRTQEYSETIRECAEREFVEETELSVANDLTLSESWLLDMWNVAYRIVVYNHELTGDTGAGAPPMEWSIQETEVGQKDPIVLARWTKLADIQAKSTRLSKAQREIILRGAETWRNGNVVWEPELQVKVAEEVDFDEEQAEAMDATEGVESSDNATERVELDQEDVSWCYRQFGRILLTHDLLPHQKQQPKYWLRNNFEGDTSLSSFQRSFIDSMLRKVLGEKRVAFVIWQHGIPSIADMGHATDRPGRGHATERPGRVRDMDMLQEGLHECLQWYVSLANQIVDHQTQEGFDACVAASSLDKEERQQQQSRRAALQKARQDERRGALLVQERESRKRSFDEMNTDEQTILEDFETGRTKRAKTRFTTPKLRPFRCKLHIND